VTSQCRRRPIEARVVHEDRRRAEAFRDLAVQAAPLLLAPDVRRDEEGSHVPGRGDRRRDGARGLVGFSIVQGDARVRGGQRARDLGADAA